MSKLYLIAAAVISIAAPATAKDAKPADAAQSGTGATAGTSRVAPQEQKYCVIETITGSRIPHKICQTRDEWLRDGFDPLEK